MQIVPQEKCRVPVPPAPILAADAKRPFRQGLPVKQPLTAPVGGLHGAKRKPVFKIFCFQRAVGGAACFFHTPGKYRKVADAHRRRAVVAQFQPALHHRGAVQYRMHPDDKGQQRTFQRQNPVQNCILAPCFLPFFKRDKRQIKIQRYTVRRKAECVGIRVVGKGEAGGQIL